MGPTRLVESWALVTEHLACGNSSGSKHVTRLAHVHPRLPLRFKVREKMWNFLFLFSQQEEAHCCLSG